MGSLDLKLCEFKIGKTYLCEEKIGKKTIGWKPAEIVDLNDKYIFAIVNNGYTFKIVKFSRITGKEFRPYLRHYKIVELLIQQYESEGK